LAVRYHGELLTLQPSVPQSRPYPAVPHSLPVSPPAGRAPGGVGMGRDASEHPGGQSSPIAGKV
jgi:hypothetical protein